MYSLLFDPCSRVAESLHGYYPALERTSDSWINPHDIGNMILLVEEIDASSQNKSGYRGAIQKYDN
jgi:hypothetical protein